MATLRVLGHPVMKDVLARLRDKATKPTEFRRLMADAGLLLGLAALEDARTSPARVATPMETARFPRLSQSVA
ncbi:MAG: uracil phosphoribosyltransferase, partial [Elusimicrobia bacterium]|nr:uracil phosphoribosyltransferase [Elusimicrobiota bacterium]